MFALTKLGIAERVVALVDDLSIGPIEPGDYAQRAAWEDEEFEERDLVTNAPTSHRFWSAVRSWPGPLMVWMSSRSGLELCGLHALVSRLPSAPIHVIDVAEVALHGRNGEPFPGAGRSFSSVRDEQIIEHSLIEMATPLDDVARASLQDRWKRLGQENAALRIPTEQGLVSRPMSYLDDRIRARITSEWQSCGRVLGGVMRNGRFQEFHSDTVIFRRVLHLIDREEFEGQKGPDDDEHWSLQSRIRQWAKQA